jgi:Ca2+-binding EF-hand superfamily protein
MSEYATTFGIIDGDNDGLISADELVRLMDVLGQPITAEGAQQAIAKVDADGDSLINLKEFGVWLEGRSS